MICLEVTKYIFKRILKEGNNSFLSWVGAQPARHHQLLWGPEPGQCQAETRLTQAVLPESSQPGRGDSGEIHNLVLHFRQESHRPRDPGDWLLPAMCPFCHLIPEHLLSAWLEVKDSELSQCHICPQRGHT
jgi:hypothetical protein